LTTKLLPTFTRKLKRNLKHYFQSVVHWLHRSRRKLATAGVGLLACLLAYHVVFGANGLMIYKQKRSEYRELQEQNRSIQQQNEELEKQIKALKNDPQAIEKEAREHLHYVRPGEVIYTVPPKPPEKPKQ
jgi:cell division protein FtsB